MIPAEDLKIEVLPTEERGGQHVGVRPCYVQVTHIPTGIQARIQQRSQVRAREIAIDMILAALTHPRYT